MSIALQSSDRLLSSSTGKALAYPHYTFTTMLTHWMKPGAIALIPIVNAYAPPIFLASLAGAYITAQLSFVFPPLIPLSIFLILIDTWVLCLSVAVYIVVLSPI